LFPNKSIAFSEACLLRWQKLMFDLPITEKAEAQALLKANVLGGGKRTARQTVETSQRIVPTIITE